MKKSLSLRELGLKHKVSQTTIRNWIDKGMPRKYGPEQRKWIKDYRAKHAAAAGDVETKKKAVDALTEDKRALNRIRRKREMLDYLKDKRKVVYRSVVERRLRRLFTDARVQLETIPNLVAKLASPENRDLARKMATNIVNQALKGLAGGK